MAHCKGIAVMARLRWVESHHGAQGLDRFLGALTPADRATLDGHVLPHAWVPLDLFIHVNEVADRLFGQGDLQLCVELGAWSAEQNLPRLFRLFYRLGTPMFIFNNAARLWSAHYDSGKLETWREESGLAHLVIKDFDQPHRAHCFSVLGWATKSVEISGAKVTQSLERRCRTRGDEVCELVVGWK